MIHSASLHTVPVQQSAAPWQPCPYCAQGTLSEPAPPWPPAPVAEPPLPPLPVPLAPLPLTPVPPAPALPDAPPLPPGVPGGTLQVPCKDPGLVTQLDPRQQSPVIVQPPPAATQLDAPQCSAPPASATHGRSSQQSSADAHVSPAARHLSPSPLQRGTPSRSSWHTPEFPGAAQQSLRADEMSQT